MIIHKIPKFALLLLLWIPSIFTYSQDEGLSAAVTIISGEVYIQRIGTVTELPLRERAVAPLGSGDQIRTGDNGRVFITFPDVNRLLLLPNTRYEIQEFLTLSDGRLRLEAHLEGILIQQFTEEPSKWDYRLVTEALTVVEPSELFAVWAVPERLTAAISAQGTLSMQKNSESEIISVPETTGLFAPYSNEPTPLESPLHPAQLLAVAIDCTGTVVTNGSEGLRLRSGAGLDYLILIALQDGQRVHIVGTTENGLWYRIPFQTGFGWLYSSLVDARCNNLPRFPNLVGENNEHIRQVTEPELELLQPFYGLPINNPSFYR